MTQVSIDTKTASVSFSGTWV